MIIPFRKSPPSAGAEKFDTEGYLYLALTGLMRHLGITEPDSLARYIASQPDISKGIARRLYRRVAKDCVEHYAKKRGGLH